MKKKTRQTISVEISVDSLREEAVAYMNDVFEHACIHPDICPSDEQLESDFNRNIQDPDFIRHIQYRALASIKENILNIFEDHYEDEDADEPSADGAIEWLEGYEDYDASDVE